MHQNNENEPTDNKEQIDYITKIKECIKNKDYVNALMYCQKAKKANHESSIIDQQLDIIKNYYIKKERLESILNNKLASSIPDSLYSAKRYIKDINMCAERHKLHLYSDSLLLQVLHKEFECWMEAGNNSKIESVKERCYNTARKIVE